MGRIRQLLLCILHVYGPENGIFVLIAYAQKPLLDANADVSSDARCLKFGPSLHLQPCFLYLSSEGSGESVH